MKRIPIGRRSAIVAAVAVVILALAGGIAYATIPDANKVFTACMLKNVGTIRLIDPALAVSSPMQHCTSLETQISWNQQGQPGPAGAAGAQGPKGDPGRGLGSLDDFAGLPCKTPNFDGVVEVSSTPLSSKSASVSLRCTVPNAAILTVRLEDPVTPNAAGGRVTGGPVDCELVSGTGVKTCVYLVPLGTELTLTATPISPSAEWESTFAGWTATECVGTGTCAFTVSHDTTIDAVFRAQMR